MKKLLLLLTLSTVTFQNANAALTSDLMLQGTVLEEISVDFIGNNNLILDLNSGADQSVGTFQMKSNSSTGYQISFSTLNVLSAVGDQPRLKRFEDGVASQDFIIYNMAIDGATPDWALGAQINSPYYSTSSVPYDSGLLPVVVVTDTAQESPGANPLVVSTRVAGIYRDTVTATIAPL